MKKLNDNLHNILALDSIYNVLPWTDRIRLHLAVCGRLELEATPAILQAHRYISASHWIAPETRYIKDEIELHCWYDDRYVPLEEYKELQPIKYN